MMKVINRNKIFVLISAITLVFCIFIGAFTVNKTAEAADEPVFTDELVIAHITDTHYYSASNCYAGEGGEFLDYIQDKSTKMWLESAAAFDAALLNIKDIDPDYVVVSGDIAQDGERRAHIEVANKLRALQNELRVNNPDFQVFVVTGNHDLYNPEVFDFSGDGLKKYQRFISRKDETVIYASLGFPDISEQQAIDFYDEEEETIFVNSTTAEGTEITYQYAGKEAEADYAEGELTYIAETAAGHTVIGLDVIESNEEDGHVLGGTITKATKEFLTANKSDTSFSIGIAHHSIVPHWAMEEEITTGFIIKDWIDGADFLADYGMRYVFTGHMHANDITHHISFNNNQITDIETTANLSIGSAVREVTIETGTFGNEEIQNLYTENHNLKTVDFTYLIDNGYITQKYLDLNNLNEFMDGKICTDYSSYAKRRVYDNALVNTLGGYLTPSILDGIGEMVADILPSILKGLSSSVDIIVDNLISEIETKVLADYTYSGTNEKFIGKNKLFGFIEELIYRAVNIEVAEDTKLLDFFFYCYLGHNFGNEAIIQQALPANIRQALEFCKNGGLVEALFDVLLDRKNGLYFLLDGIVNTTFDLSEGVEGAAGLVKIAGGAFLGYDSEDPLTLSNFLLSEAIGNFVNSDYAKNQGISFELNGKTIMEFLDDTLDGYLTTSFYTGLGEITANILTGFSVDPTFDGNETKTLIKVSDYEIYTYISIPRADNPTVQNGKLPGMVTVTFGKNTATTKNFTWFTDKRVTDSVVQYTEKSAGDFNAANALSQTGTSEIYCYTMPLIDLGIIAQLGYNEIGRHMVGLTGLKPNTEYYYRIGSPSFGYFSEVATFKTAPDGDTTPFEVLLIADLQGFTNSNYVDAGEVLENAASVFENGYDFVINAGDAVDNSKNMDQFGYLLNTLNKYWANTTQIVTAGNHEESSFEYSAEDYTTSSESVITSEYNNLLLHYNISVPNQSTLTGAYYSFDYSGVHFTVLNTNDVINDVNLGTEQTEWLIRDLKNTAKKHKVVIMHKGLYSSGSHSFDAEVIGMRKQLTPIFNENDVHLVLSGHDHTYSETFYLDEEGNKIKGALNGNYKLGTKGTLYVTLGTLGNKFYKYVENDKVPVSTGVEFHNPTLSKPTFGKLVFDGEDLYYQGYEYDFDTQKVSGIDKKGLTSGNLTGIIIGGVFVALLAIGGALIRFRMHI